MHIINKNQRLNYNINKNLIYSVRSEERDEFNYFIPISISQKSIQQVSKIKIDFIKSSSFSQIFNNKYFDMTSTFTNHNTSSFFKQDFKNDIRKNMYPKYNNTLNINSSKLELNDFVSVEHEINSSNTSSFFSTGNNRRVEISELVDFQRSLYTNQESIAVSNQNNSLFFSYFYLFRVPQTLSTKISTNQIDYFRAMFFDQNSNLIAKSEVYNFDFENLLEEKQIIDSSIYYNENFSQLSDNIRLIFTNFSNYDFMLSVDGLQEVDQIRPTNININIKHTQSNLLITESFGISQFENGFSSISIFNSNSGLNSFIERLVFGYCFLEEENFNFDVQVILTLGEQNKEIYLNLNKTISLNKNSNFITSILSNREILRSNLSNIINQISIEQISEKIDENTLKNTVSLTSSGEISNEILKKVKVLQVLKNQFDISNNIYNDRNKLFSNKMYIIDKSLSELLNSGRYFTYFTDLNSRNNQTNIVLSISEVDFLEESISKSFVSQNFIFSNNSSNIRNIEKINKTFSKNLKITSLEKSPVLNDRKDSFVDIKSIELRNINSFSSFAQQFGYTLESNNLPDVLSFLENCIIVFENYTTINSLNIRLNKSNICFFENVFVRENIDQTNEYYFSSTENFSGLVINTDDLYAINILDNSDMKNSLFTGFLTSDSDNSKYEYLKNLLEITPALKIDNKLEIYIVPIPRIISYYKGEGVDSLSNPVNLTSSQKELIDGGQTITLTSGKTINLESRKNLSVALEDYLYVSEISLNPSLFDSLKTVLLSSDSLENRLEYYSLFDVLVKKKISPLSIAKFKNSIDMSIVFKDLESIINIDNTSQIESFRTQYIEEGLINNFFNISNFSSENINNFNYTIDFLNNQSNSELGVRTIKTKNIMFVQNTSDFEILFDISNLISYSNIDQILSIKPRVRSCPIFVMTSRNGNINNTLSERLDDSQFFDRVIYNDKNCIIYNHNYVIESQRNSIFKNYTNENMYYNSFSIEKEQERFYLKLKANRNNQSNVFQNNFYSYVKSFFDFCVSESFNVLEDVIERFSISFEIENKNMKPIYFTIYFNGKFSKNNRYENHIVYIDENTLTLTKRSLF